MTNLIEILITILFYPIKHVVPKGNIILIGTYSRQRYCDNTKFLFEYLSENSEIDIYWLTDNETIEEYLKKNGLQYVGLGNPLKLIWILLRARIIIDSGTNYFNPFKILDTKSVIKITTLHGNGPKATFSRFHPPDNSKIAIQQILSHYSFDFVNYPSKYSAEKIGKRAHLLPNEKIISLGYPRCDQYFDQVMLSDKKEKKLLTKSIFPNYTDDLSIIFYTPTWRPYEFNFPLFEMDDFDIDEFDQWLTENNIVFFYSIHTAQLPENMPRNLKRIIEIRPENYPLFDTNEFLIEVDILINDYSTTSTDFALLKKPQIFFMPDYDYYYSEKGFIEDYKDIIPGKEISNYRELKDTIKNINHAKNKYLDQYDDQRTELLEKYYDFNDGNSSKMFYSFIQELMG